MAPDKQQRRLARQRGAGPRELKNAAFNLSFGAPALAPPSARKTPRPRTKSPQKTPAPAPSTGKRKRVTPTPVQSARAPSAKTPAAHVVVDEEADELSPDAAPVAIDETELPQLRRVSIPILPLNRASPRPPQSPDRRPPREERGRSRTRKSIVSVSYSQSRSRLDTLEEDQDEDEDEIDATAGAVSGKTVSPQPSQQLDELTELTEATPSTRRAGSRRKSTGRSRRKTGTSVFDGGTSAFLMNQAAQSTRRQVFDTATDELDAAEHPPPQSSVVGLDTTVYDIPQSEDELTPEPQKASRPRKSGVDILPDSEDVEDQDELSPQQDPTLDIPIASVRTPLADRNTNNVRSRQRQEGERHDGKRPRTEISPEPDQGQQEQARKRLKKATSDRIASKKYGGPTIPITIYRRTKLADDDPLGVNPEPTPSLQAPDILSQISTEVVNAYISNVPDAVVRSSGSKAGAKKSMRYQMQALQQFRDNLADALRNITFAQHSLHNFGSEVRKARKRKRELREELMSRRRAREEIEIEIEKVRSDHLKAEREHAKQRQLIDDIEAIEQAVRRAREEASKSGGYDAPAQTVVADAEDVAARLGMLRRVQDFNSFLAKTAEAL